LTYGCASVLSVHWLSIGINDHRGGNGSDGNNSDDNGGNDWGGAKELIGVMSDETTLVVVENTAVKNLYWSYTAGLYVKW